MSGEFQSQVLSALSELQKGQAELQKGQAELRKSHAELQGRFAGLQEGFAGQRAILDRVEGKVDKLVRDMDSVRPRVSAMELSSAQGLVATATLHSRMDEHETRLALVERRLELRDK